MNAGTDAKHDWSPTQYLKFADERTRAARDLLAQVPLPAPKRVADIGCGPGNSTELLAGRWPDAAVVGFDTSPDMIAEARRRLPGAAFDVADVRHWQPAGKVDVIFANAVLQWLPDHAAVMLRLMDCLAPGGVLAVQMPDNVAEPSHRLMRETAESLPFAKKLAGAARPPLPPAVFYYDLLKPKAARVDVWHTIYNHPMADAGAIVEWVKGTGLKPFVDPLSPGERALFLSRYREGIEAAYPGSPEGSMLLRFPRLFLVATVA